MILLATAPLTRNEDWQPLGAGEMQVFADGERVWTSAPPVAAS
jgi:predicted glutamine amidotransferase